MYSSLAKQFLFWESNCKKAKVDSIIHSQSRKLKTEQLYRAISSGIQFKKLVLLKDKEETIKCVTTCMILMCSDQKTTMQVAAWT